MLAILSAQMSTYIAITILSITHSRIEIIEIHRIRIAKKLPDE